MTPMKLLFLLFLLIPPVNAHHVNSGTACFKEAFEERYIPGYEINGRWITGRVTVDRKRLPIPCHNHPPAISQGRCKANATTGGLIGGGIAAAVSEKDAYGWSLPLGALLGIGLNNEVCQ